MRGYLHQDQCMLSTDLKQFRRGFDLLYHGLYLVVVKLGDIPLTFTVAAKTGRNLNSSMNTCSYSRTISTSPALPDLTRTSVVPAEIKAVSTTTKVETSKLTRNDLSNISSNCGQENDLAVKTAANGQTPPS